MIFDQLLAVARTLQIQEWLFVCLMIPAGAIIANFLILIHTQKYQGFLRFLSNLLFSRALVISILFCLFDFAFAIALYGWSPYALFIGCVLFLFYVMSYIDSILLAIPDWLNFLCFFGIFGAMYGLGILEREVFLSSFCAAGGLAMLRIFGNFVFKKEILGEADIVVFASMSAFLSIDWAIYMITLSSMLAMGYILLVSLFALQGKEITLSKIKVPFVLFLTLGFIIVLACLEIGVQFV